MKGIIWEVIENKEICEYVYQQKKFWEPVSYKGKHYMMTFEENIYEVIV